MKEQVKIKDNKQYGLIIQPGAVGDVILTVPLIRLLRKRMGLNGVDIMGRTERLSLLVGRCEVGSILSMEQAGFHRLFEDSKTFELPEGDPLIELLRPYDIIATFLKDDQGNFEQNLIYTAWFTHAAEVMTLDIRPGEDWPGHAAGFYMQQFYEQRLRESGIVRQITTRQQMLQVASFQELMSYPLLSAKGADLERGRQVLTETGVRMDRPLIAVHPGSGGNHKCWSIKEFCALADILAGGGRQVLFLWGPAEEERWGAEVKALVGQKGPVLEGLSLEEVAGILSHCAAYVGNDCGISHLAGALDIPLVAIFGPSNTRHWQPLGTKVRICQSKSGQSGDWPNVEEVAEKITEILE